MAHVWLLKFAPCFGMRAWCQVSDPLSELTGAQTIVPACLVTRACCEVPELLPGIRVPDNLPGIASWLGLPPCFVVSACCDAPDELGAPAARLMSPDGATNLSGAASGGACALDADSDTLCCV